MTRHLTALLGGRSRYPTSRNIAPKARLYGGCISGPLMNVIVVSRQGSSDSVRAYVKNGAVKKCGLLSMKHVLSRSPDMKVSGTFSRSSFIHAIIVCVGGHLRPLRCALPPSGAGSGTMLFCVAPPCSSLWLLTLKFPCACLVCESWCFCSL
jgi:hypothetical protein